MGVSGRRPEQKEGNVSLHSPALTYSAAPPPPYSSYKCHVMRVAEDEMDGGVPSPGKQAAALLPLCAVPHPSPAAENSPLWWCLWEAGAIAGQVGTQLFAAN